jgi:anaphase-promoting complex subunit 4
MGKPSRPRLLEQAEKSLLHPVRPHLISYCPTMDLVALVTEEETLDVFRINGQRAFGLKRKSSTTTVDYICWQFNGQAIAVAWSDGCTDILSAETGKVIHPNVPAPAVGSGTPRIQCIGSALNFIDVDFVKRRTGSLKGRATNGKTSTIALTGETTDDWDSFKDGTSIEDFLQRQPDLEALDVAPDLPDQLAMMDMETLLPKLPAIPLPPATPFMRPVPQADTASFSSQAQVDSLLHSHQLKEHNSVDILIRCTTEGTVHPSVYDSMETVNVQLPASWSLKSRPIAHTSHPYSCSHGLLTEVRSATETKLAFVPLTLGFIQSAGIYLHLIASKTSQLQNLLLYVQQCVQRIRTYWKHSRDLPTKFMMNIGETLEEKGQGDLVQNLYHLACTGNCPELIKEWLVDELAEAGHKRWDTTVTTSLATVIQLLHENLLPALDRCAVVISRLRGLAKYHEAGWIFNTPVTEFTALLEHLEKLRLLGHTALLYANDEKRSFQFFSKWLRYEIDFEATEPGGQSRAEMEAKDPGVDIGIVLDYIRYGLTKSDLESFLQPEDQLSDAQREAEASSYQDTVKAIDLAKDGAAYKPEAICFDHVLRHFRAGCSKLFQQISQWQANNITMDCGIVLEGDLANEGESLDVFDMRMVYEVSNTLTAPLVTSSTSVMRC